MKRVLMVTYEFPPCGGSGVQRSLYFAKYLREFGWEPVVLQADRIVFGPADPGLLRELPAGVERHVVAAREPAIITEKWRRAFGGERGAARILANAVGWVVTKFANRIGYWLLPDEKALWARRALAAGRRICRQGIDVIYSSAPRYTAHWVAWRLKRRLGLPWVADFRDLWTRNTGYWPGSLLKRFSDRWYERRYLNCADAVVSVSRFHTESLAAERSPQRRERFVTITNGFEPGIFEGAEPLRGPEGAFTLRYLGALTMDRISPELIGALRRGSQALAGRGKRLRVEWYGPSNRRVLAKLGTLGESFRYMGYVPHEDVPSLLLGADALLLSINRHACSRGVLTGKIFEYLGSGRPILCVTPVEGEAAEMIRKYDAGVVGFSGDEESIGSGLDLLVAAWERGRALRGADPSRLTPLHRRTLTGRLAGVLDAVVAGRPPGPAPSPEAKGPAT